MGILLLSLICFCIAFLAGYFASWLARKPSEGD